MRILILGITAALWVACCAGVMAQDSRGRTRTKPTSGPDAAPKGPPARADFGTFSFQPPKDWKTKRAPGGTGMRRAEYLMPAVKGDDRDAEFIVFYFPGGGGPVEANLNRWKSQVSKRPGATDEQHSKTSRQKVDGIPVTIAELRGDYDPGAAMGAPKQKNIMMLAAIIEAPGGTYYIRTMGPLKTMEHHAKAWYQMILQLKAKK